MGEKELWEALLEASPFCLGAAFTPLRSCLPPLYGAACSGCSDPRVWFTGSNANREEHLLGARIPEYKLHCWDLRMKNAVLLNKTSYWSLNWYWFSWGCTAFSLQNDQDKDQHCLKSANTFNISRYLNWMNLNSGGRWYLANHTHYYTFSISYECLLWHP